MKGKARTAEQKLEIFRSLEEYFKLGYSLNKACKTAGIPSSTAHDIISSSETLRIKMEALQNLVTTESRKVVVEKITKDRDVATAKWWLERKEPNEFQARQKVESDIPFVDLGLLRKIKEGRLQQVVQN